MERGNCYLNSLAMIAMMDVRGHTLHLCHGVAVLTRPPYVEFGHAWIEATPTGDGPALVFDHQSPLHPILRDAYYEIGQVRPDTVVRYTRKEAREMADRRGTPGPWDAVVAAAAHADG
jgi:hypothetical protein